MKIIIILLITLQAFASNIIKIAEHNSYIMGEYMNSESFYINNKEKGQHSIGNIKIFGQIEYIEEVFYKKNTLKKIDTLINSLNIESKNKYLLSSHNSVIKDDSDKDILIKTETYYSVYYKEKYYEISKDTYNSIKKILSTNIVKRLQLKSDKYFYIEKIINNQYPIEICDISENNIFKLKDYFKKDNIIFELNNNEIYFNNRCLHSDYMNSYSVYIEYNKNMYGIHFLTNKKYNY